jgi:hypothetical protein
MRVVSARPRDSPLQPRGQGTPKAKRRMDRGGRRRKSRRKVNAVCDREEERGRERARTREREVYWQ